MYQKSLIRINKQVEETKKALAKMMKAIMKKLNHVDSDEEDGNLNMRNLQFFYQLYQQNREVFLLAAPGFNSRQAVQEQADKYYQIMNQNALNIASLRVNQQMDWLERPLNFEVVEQNNEYMVIHNVIISREGQFTCPVECLIVFISNKKINLKDNVFNMFIGRKSIDSIYQLSQMYPKHLQIFKVHNNIRDVNLQQTDQTNSIGVEFKFSTNLALKPVFWFKFADKRINRIEVKLDQKFSGKYLYTKLIDYDDRMAEFQTLDLPNVDCNFVGIRGDKLIVPQ